MTKENDKEPNESKQFPFYWITLSWLFILLYIIIETPSPLLKKKEKKK